MGKELLSTEEQRRLTELVSKHLSGKPMTAEEVTEMDALAEKAYAAWKGQRNG